VVYSIIAGRATGLYPPQASKPSDFVAACKALENRTSLERGLRILASRMLPPLYEIRNNRDVGHVGGDVDPNYMDSAFSIAAASWLLAELIRVFHQLDVRDAKRLVDQITQIKTPSVWIEEDIRRVLNPKMKLSDQCLLLIASAGTEATFSKLLDWTETKNRTYMKRIIAELHKIRQIEAAQPDIKIRLLPAGAEKVRALLSA
jgi:hypothetical protein